VFLHISSRLQHLFEVSEMQAGPSKESVQNTAKFALEPSPQLDRFDIISREIGRPLSSASVSSRERPGERRRPISIAGQEFSYEIIGHSGATQSPTSAYYSAEQLRSRKLYSYEKLWRNNFILTLGKWFHRTTLSIFPTNISGRWWRCPRLLSTDHSESSHGQSGRYRAEQSG
jgi:hypothetical protein